jgi:hypothetical protein
MSSKIKVDVSIEPPESVFDICNDVIQHAIPHLLIPSSELLSKWLTEDGKYPDEEERKAFLEYFKFEIEWLSEKDDEREQIIQSSVMDSQKIEQIAPVLQSFILLVQEKVFVLVLDRFLNIFLTPKESDVTATETIAESISRVAPINRATDVTTEIEDAVFDLLTSIKLDLETDEAKSVMSMISGNRDGDGEADDEDVNAEFERVMQELSKKHGYEGMAVKQAQTHFVPLLMTKLDGIMEEVCSYLRDRVYQRVEEMLIEDRNSLPGPQYME